MAKKKFKFDLVITGGGTSGVATALSAANSGLKVLIIEETSHLGGAMTGGLVVPMMNNISLRNKNSILIQVLDELRKTNDSIIYNDGNPGWFNPEKMKYTLEKFCSENNIEIFYNTNLHNVSVKNQSITKLTVNFKGSLYYIESKYYVDATGDATLSNMLKIPSFVGDETTGKTQPVSLRFNMGNVDIKKLTQWLVKQDKDKSVTNVSNSNKEPHFTTAYTFDDKKWGLKKFFEQGIKKEHIRPSDVKYFQIFSVAGQPGVVAFNCPRIDLEIDPLDIESHSKALKEGREAIQRIAFFCKKTFPGFENAFISTTATSLGVRDSRRVKGKYILSEKDYNSFCKSTVAKSNYPQDIHSNTKNKSELTKKKCYEIPLECLKVPEFKNLFVTGRCISANFKMQSSLRVQPTCFEMGENLGKYISYLHKKGDKDEKKC